MTTNDYVTQKDHIYCSNHFQLCNIMHATDGQITVRFAQFPPTWDLVVSYFKQQDLAIAGEINFMQVRALF